QMLFGGLVLLGGLIGAGFIAFNSDLIAPMNGSIPPAMAVILAVILATAVLWASIAYNKRADEIAIVNNIHASATGSFVLLAGYPLWFLLWKGGLLPEPSHMIMFGVVCAVIGCTHLVRTYR
ncbi:MAG: hypothetical protein ACKVOP_09750, partial [Sphingomonadaceae bacterium]